MYLDHAAPVEKIYRFRVRREIPKSAQGRRSKFNSVTRNHTRTHGGAHMSPDNAQAVGRRTTNSAQTTAHSQAAGRRTTNSAQTTAHFSICSAISHVSLAYYREATTHQSRHPPPLRRRAKPPRRFSNTCAWDLKRSLPPDPARACITASRTASVCSALNADIDAAM